MGPLVPWLAFIKCGDDDGLAAGGTRRIAASLWMFGFQPRLLPRGGKEAIFCDKPVSLCGRELRIKTRSLGIIIYTTLSDFEDYSRGS